MELDNREYLNAIRAPMPISPMFGQRTPSMAITQSGFPIQVDSPPPTDTLASLVPKVSESCPVPVFTPIKHQPEPNSQEMCERPRKASSGSNDKIMRSDVRHVSVSFSGSEIIVVRNRRTKCMGKVELPIGFYKVRCEEKIALLKVQLDSMTVKSGPAWQKLRLSGALERRQIIMQCNVEI